MKFIRKHNRKLLSLVFIAGIFLLALHNGLTASYTSDFSYINGSWQSYNPVRRLFSGQVPFYDFTVYLGMGALYGVASIMLFVGNSFTSSLFATHFFTFLCASAAIFCVMWVVLQNRNKALFATLISGTVVLYCSTLLGGGLPEIFTTAVEFSLLPGNSARMIRYFGVFFAFLAAVGSLKLVRYLAGRFAFFKTHQLLVSQIAAAFVCGASVVWSNEVGASLYLAFSFMYFCVMLTIHGFKLKKLLGCIAVFIGSSVAGLLTVVLVTTRGHVGAWFAVTFGVGSYQYWYYGYEEHKVTSVLQADLSLTVLVLCAIFLFFIWLVYKNRNDIGRVLRYASLCFFSLSTIIVCNIYRLFSGHLITEMAKLLVVIFAFSALAKLVDWLAGLETAKPVREQAIALSTAICIAISLSSAWVDRTDRMSGSERSSDEFTYVDALRGYLSTDTATNLLLAQDILEGSTFFSTYAGALDAMLGTYQPSGADYIIHTMGDRQRENYLDAFSGSNPDYAVTLSNDNEWECWVRNANWFFYRELYNNWQPSFSNGDQIFWTPSARENGQQLAHTVVVEQVAASTVEITVETSDPGFMGVVDLYIDYDVEKLPDWRNVLALHRNVFVTGSTEQELMKNSMMNFYLPAQKNQTHISLIVASGKGTIVLKANPENITALTVYEATATQFFTAPFDTIYPLENDTYEGILLANDRMNNASLLGATALETVDGREAPIVGIVELDNGYLLVNIGNAAKEEGFQYPCAVRISQRE